jgi:hypothetical protein
MRIRNLALVLVLLSAVALPQDPQKGKSPRSGILVLNLLRTIDESDEGREIIARLKEEQATKKQKLTEEAAMLQEKAKLLREAKPVDRTPDYYKELERTWEAAARIEMEKNLFLAKKQDEVNRAMQQLLILAQQIARDVMKQRDAEVVLLTKTGPIELATDQDQQQEFMMRRVLCCDDSIEITDEVIRKMNEWYKENKSSGGPPKREAEGAKAEPAKEAPAGAVKEKASKSGG